MLRWMCMADKEEKIEFEGEVIESFRSGMYRIQLDNGHETLGYTSARMRRYRIRINPGDHVKFELSPYDRTRRRIVYRTKQPQLFPHAERRAPPHCAMCRDV